MAITFIGTPLQETFVNTSYFEITLADPNEPAGSVIQREVFADNSVNYGLSTEAVFIDRETTRLTQLATRSMRAKARHEQEYGNGKRNISELAGGARVSFRPS